MEETVNERNSRMMRELLEAKKIATKMGNKFNKSMRNKKPSTRVKLNGQITKAAHKSEDGSDIEGML